MTNLPNLSNSLLPAGLQVGSPEDIYGSARDVCHWNPRPAWLDKSKLSELTWSEPGEAGKAQRTV